MVNCETVFPSQILAVSITRKLLYRFVSGGECKGVWGKGTSWRVTGLSPTTQGTGSYEFHTKDPHCPNPYCKYTLDHIYSSEFMLPRSYSSLILPMIVKF